MSAIALDIPAPSAAPRADREGGTLAAALDRPVARTVGRERLLGRIEHELELARPVSLRGGRGVGKSRLLAELGSRHVGPVQLLAGAEVAGGAAAAPTVRDRPDGDGSLLLLVDDAQRLPSLEVARLHALQGQPWCRVVTTVSTDDHTEVSPRLGRWWLADRWRSLEVAPLTRTATADLLAQLLGGLPEPRLVRAVWSATGGHPVAVVEVVRDAHELGCIAPGSDSWRQVAPLPVRRLAAMVGDRLNGLTEAARHDLHVLAIASPLPIRAASGLLRPSAVKELESRGLVRFRADRTGRTLSIVDAVHAEVVRADLGAADRDQVLREVADALERAGITGRRALDIARWRLQVGGWSAQALGSAAARAHCAGDPGLAEALAGAALQGRPDAATARIEALAGVELRAGLAPVSPASPTSPPSGRGAPRDDRHQADPIVRAQALAIGAGDWGVAVDGLRVVPADQAPAAPAYAALLAALGGRPADAEVLLAAGADGTLARAAAVLVAAEAGDAAGARAAADEVAPCEDGTDLLPIAADLVQGQLLLVSTDELLEDRIDRAAAAVDRSLERLSAATAWWYAVEGWLRWQSGDLGEARRRLTAALLACADADPIRLRPRLVADLALLAALTGAVIEAQWRLGQVGHDRDANPAVAGRCAVTEHLVAAHRNGGRPDPAVLVGLARDAARDGRHRDAAWICHLVVRSADPQAPDTPIGDLAAADELVAAHIAAWADRDAAALDGVARRFAAAGRRLLAAEAAAAAARLGAGERTAALAAALAAACDDASRPGIADLGPVRISPRRRDAAVLAMHGCDDRRIAAELGLSVRTVENHLAKVYRQVGVSGRAELAELFDPTCPPFDRAAVAVG